jgi:hypothetical protein
MRALLLCFLLVAVSICKFGVHCNETTQLVNTAIDTLLLNNKSSIASDVAFIVHDLNKRIVRVEMKPERKCSDPSFVVRLSGTALHKLKFAGQKKMELSGNTAYFFSYHPIMDAGQYFVEVLVVYCDEFKPDAFTDLCVISPQNAQNILTVPTPVQLTVTKPTLSESYSESESQSVYHEVRSPAPRWVLTGSKGASDLSTSITTSNSTLISPLPTRYQRMCGSKLCPLDHKSGSLAQHRRYRLVGQPDWFPLLQQLTTQLEPFKWHLQESAGGGEGSGIIHYRSINICFFGDSHTRMLLNAMQELYRAHFVKGFVPLVYPVLNFKYTNVKFPHMFQTADLHSMQCSVVLLTSGQWMVSPLTNSVYNRTFLEQELHRMMDRATPPLYTGPAKLFLRSENYNGMGFLQNCSVRDFRTPPVFDMVNSVIRAEAKARAVPFIDLNDIMGPMWDAAEDFCHPYGPVAAAEAVTVLNHILGAALVNGSSAAPIFVSQIKVGTVIRFADRSLYLRNGLKLRKLQPVQKLDHRTATVHMDWEKVFFSFSS